MKINFRLVPGGQAHYLYADIDGVMYWIDTRWGGVKIRRMLDDQKALRDRSFRIEDLDDMIHALVKKKLISDPYAWKADREGGKFIKAGKLSDLTGDEEISKHNQEATNES